MIEQVMGEPKARFKLSGDHALLAEYLMVEGLEANLAAAGRRDSSIYFHPNECAFLLQMLAAYKASVAANIAAEPRTPEAP